MSARATQNRAISYGLNSLQEYLRESVFLGLYHDCLRREVYRWCHSLDGLSLAMGTPGGAGERGGIYLTLCCLIFSSRVCFQMHLALILTKLIQLTIVLPLSGR